MLSETKDVSRTVGKAGKAGSCDRELPVLVDETVSSASHASTTRRSIETGTTNSTQSTIPTASQRDRGTKRRLPAPHRMAAVASTPADVMRFIEENSAAPRSYSRKQEPPAGGVLTLEEPQYLTSLDCAKIGRFSLRTIMDALIEVPPEQPVPKGRLRGTKVRRRWRVTRAAFKEFMGDRR